MAGYRIVAPEALEQLGTQVFETLGTPSDIARDVAAHLVRANLAGHDSHGAIRIPQYAMQIEQGVIKPAARPAILKERGAAMLLDGGFGFGQFAASYALEWAIQAAQTLGVGAVAIRHANHLGRLGDYVDSAARRGFVAEATVGSGGPSVGGAAPFGGAARFLGTNPWAIGIPRADGDPVLVDFATTVVAEGKVRVALSKNEPLPPGCIVDKAGAPSTNPEDYYGGGMLLPFGAHKGYGLSLASALLGGLGAIGQENPSLAGTPAPAAPANGERTGGALLVVLDPGAFGERDAFAAQNTRVTAALKRVPAAPGFGEVLLPGEPEARNTAQRRSAGVAVPDDTWAAIADVAAKAGVPMPDAKVA
jgi:LDH2 family malate/lactate/ureidoglycolate dehydrogenase